MSYHPGQTLTLKSDDHYVYALIDDDEQVFYVGKSAQPFTRLQQHVRYGQPRVKDKIAGCRQPRLRILAGPVPEVVAELIEELCIRAGVRFCDLANQETRPWPLGPQPRSEYVEYFTRWRR